MIFSRLARDTRHRDRLVYLNFIYRYLPPLIYYYHGCNRGNDRRQVIFIATVCKEIRPSLCVWQYYYI